MNGRALAKSALRSAGLTRRRVAAARMCCERHVIARVSHHHERRSRILCYHSVGTPEWGVNDVSPSRFRRQLECALADGWRFVPAAELASGDAPRGSLAVTFDDGVASVVHTAAPILSSLGIPWSLFVVAEWADGRHRWDRETLLGWRDIEHAARLGAEVGSHSLTHPDFGRLAPAEAAHELSESRRLIELRTGITSRTFAIPFGQSGNWSPAAQSAARDAGYVAVFAQSEERRPGETVPRTFITRFDGDRVFRAALGGAFDRWEEWL